MTVYKSKYTTATKAAMTELEVLVADLKTKQAAGELLPGPAEQIAREALGQIAAANADPNAGELIAMDSQEVRFLESLLPANDPLRSDSPAAKSLAAMDKALDQAGRFAKSMIHVGTAAAARL